MKDLVISRASRPEICVCLSWYFNVRFSLGQMKAISSARFKSSQAVHSYQQALPFQHSFRVPFFTSETLPPFLILRLHKERPFSVSASVVVFLPAVQLLVPFCLLTDWIFFCLLCCFSRGRLVSWTVHSSKHFSLPYIKVQMKQQHQPSRSRGGNVCRNVRGEGGLCSIKCWYKISALNWGRRADR